MLKKVLLISLVIIGVFILVWPNVLDYFGRIPDEGQKITKELTDPEEDGESFTDNIQKAFAYVGQKIEGLAFSANVFLTKQGNNKTSQIEEEGFYGKINGQGSDVQKTTGTSGSGSSGGPSGSGAGTGGHAGNNGNSNQGNTLTPSPISDPTTPPASNDIPIDTLSLITKKQSDNKVSMKYEDTSGKTINVTVQIRNEERVIFSGQFFSSSFETIILDASATPHFIDLVVEHELYGRVIATAYIPKGSTDTVIFGAFAKD